MPKKVKTITIHRLDAIYPNGPENPPEFNGYKQRFTAYDEAGNIIEESKFESDGTTIERQVYNYNEKGQLIEEINYLDTGEMADHKTYERDDKGKIVKVFKHYLDGSKDTVAYVYDSMGNLKEKITIDSYDEVESREVFEFKNDLLVSRKQIEYDDLMSEETYSYDEKGNPIHQTLWSEESEKIKFENHFDEKGNLLISKRFNEKDQLVERIEYTLNSNAKPIRIEEESRAGKTVTSIEYDQHGNAIKQTETDEQGNISNQAVRQFDEENRATESEITINFYGRAIDQHYILKYEYEFFDQD